MYDENALGWVDLPIRGAVFEQLVFVGHGKNSEARIETTGHPPVIVPNKSFIVSFLGGMKMSQRALDDRDIEIKIVAPADGPIILAEAKINWWLPKEDWEEELARWREGREWELTTVVASELSFARKP